MGGRAVGASVIDCISVAQRAGRGRPGSYTVAGGYQQRGKEEAAALWRLEVRGKSGSVTSSHW